MVFHGNRAKIVFYRGSRFLVYPGVYEPAEDTFLLADNLEFRSGERVLELGTGCGLLSILAAKAGARVVATDINPVALECARENAVEHGVAGSIDFRLGDLFDPVRGESFDLLVFNPPYLPSEGEERSSDPVELAWDGGKDGRRVLDRFLREFPHHLKPEGRAFFVQSSLSNVFQTKQMLETNNFKFKALEKKLFFERLYLFICFRS